MYRFNQRDITLDGINVHLWEGGKGFPLLLIHGSGPGAGTVGNWRLVLQPLAERYHVFATDLIGFGESGRKDAEPYFDLNMWLRQAQMVLDLIPEGPVGVIGHSLSATFALNLAAANDRITKVLTTGAMGEHFFVNEHTIDCWTFPKTREDLRRTVESLVYDPSVVTDAFIDARMEILHDGVYGPYFSAMFAGDRQFYVDAAVLDKDMLQSLSCDVVMMHGRDDLPFPFLENTAPLSRDIPNADVVMLANCGHSPALEHPDKLVATAKLLFG